MYVWNVINTNFEKRSDYSIFICPNISTNLMNNNNLRSEVLNIFQSKMQFDIATEICV